MHVCAPSTSGKRVAWIPVCVGDTQFAGQTITKDDEDVPRTPPINIEDRPPIPLIGSDGHPFALGNILAPEQT